MNIYDGLAQSLESEPYLNLVLDLVNITKKLMLLNCGVGEDS